MIEQSEEWHNIKGYEGFYQVSNHGRVRSIDRILNDGKFRKGKLLKQQPPRNKQGVIVTLSKNSQLKNLISNLVANAFLESIPTGHVIWHIDENIANNHLSNLKPITLKERHTLIARMHGIDKPLLIKKEITQDILKDFFDYKEGDLFYKKKTNYNDQIGTSAIHGRPNVKFFNQEYRSSHLIYLFHYGIKPNAITHLNGDPADMRIENLRATTISKQTTITNKIRWAKVKSATFGSKRYDDPIVTR